jgi:paraquat-inducible protein B
VILLGAGSFSGAEPEAIAYFEDSVSGLDIGAPVKFRGVTIGKVGQVLLHTSGQSAADYSVPVVMEFSPDLLTAAASTKPCSRKKVSASPSARASAPSSSSNRS